MHEHKRQNTSGSHIVTRKTIKETEKYGEYKSNSEQLFTKRYDDEKGAKWKKNNEKANEEQMAIKY